MLVPAFLIAAAFATSILSAVLGMAGGLLLMTLLPLVLSVQAAMVAHGTIQFFANGFRATLLARFVDKRIVLFSVCGAVFAVAAASCITFVPSRSAMYLALGVLPFVRYLPFPAGLLRIDRPGRAAISGFLVMAVQIFAGVGGPLLDVFFVDAPLEKRAVVATKAASQAAGHVLKTAYFLVLARTGAADGLTAAEVDLLRWTLPFAVVFAFLGTAVGSRLLDRVSETLFRKLTARTVEALGLFCLVKASLLGAG